jgi:cytochrome c553
VVSRRLPIGTRRPRLEVPTSPEAVALGHLATHVDDLAISRKLPEDSANFQGLELLKWSLSIHEGQTTAGTCQNLLLASMASAVAMCASCHWRVDEPRAPRMRR